MSTVLTNIVLNALRALIFISTVSTNKIPFSIYSSIALIFCMEWIFCMKMDFQSAKSFGKLRLWAFQPYHLYYICRHCRYKTRISNAFNAIYVDTVDTKHTHTFLLITFLIFNGLSIRKKFWKAETQGFSTIPSILYMSTLSIQDKDL